MNYYAFIPLSAFVATLFTWTYIYAQRRYTAVNSAYLTFAGAVAVWMFQLFLLWSPLPDPSVLTLEKLTTTTGFLVVFLFLHFTVIFLEHRRDAIYYAFAAVSLGSIVLNLTTDSYVAGYVRYPWGVSLLPGPYFMPLVAIAFVAPMGYAFGLIYQRMRLVHDTNTQKQLAYLLQGTALFFFANILFDFLLPHIFQRTALVRLGVPSGVCQSLFVFLSVRKHNFLSISFEEITNALFTNLKDGILLIDQDEYILQSNAGAQAIFQRDARSIQGSTMSALLPLYQFEAHYQEYETTLQSSAGLRILSLSQADVRQYKLAVGKILIVRDITESKRAQVEILEHKERLEQLAAELAEANALLEQKVAARTRSLQLSNEQLQREVYERQRVEEALAAETERLTVTLQSIGDGVITTDTTGTVLLLNRVAEQLTGWHAAEALKKPLAVIFDVRDEKTHQPCGNLVAEVLCSNSTISHHRDTLLRARDGTERVIAENGAPIRDRDGKILGVVLVFRDMTDVRQFEDELIKADKLESIGLLAGGIAHDFNNILTAVVGNISLAQLCLPGEHQAMPLLDEAERAAMRAQHLTQQLLTFAKGGLPVKKPTSLKELLKESVEFSLRGSNVRCAMTLPDDIWPANVDEGQITQVINNLVINANQAMPQGGVLEVSAMNIALPLPGGDAALPLPPGPYVKMSLKDHGVGIAEEHRQKIFDPYFTTKEHGNGLGLFTAYAIIKKHDGHIAVVSDVGVGTTFDLYLPALISGVVPPQPTRASLTSGTGKVLIMDDERMIRDVSAAMLRRFGYDVVLVEDGAQALARYREALVAGQPFAAVIMDLTIPGGLGGKETIGLLLELDPQAKAIVVSGYSNDPILAHYDQYGFCGYLVKPYKSEELLQVLQRVMTAAPS
ncbi:MAG: PAS domain S-box protein [Candidatus Tectimicrobiota bacterium]